MIMITTMTTMTMTKVMVGKYPSFENSGHQSKMHRELTTSTHVEISGGKLDKFEMVKEKLNCKSNDNMRFFLSPFHSNITLSLSSQITV